jgi:hypothetical protein
MYKRFAGRYRPAAWVLLLCAVPAPVEEGRLLLRVQLVRCGGLVPSGAAGDDQLVRCKQ